MPWLWQVAVPPRDLLPRGLSRDMRKGEKMAIICRACGNPTDICYTDEGYLGLTHGTCLCRACYIAQGHPECPHCKTLLSPEWVFCPRCGEQLPTKGIAR